ncbi:MAG: IS1182 family transposase [Bryobacteraceae bacterium]
MLTATCLLPLVDPERQAFLEVVPEDHFLRRLPQAVDFEQFRSLVESCYKAFGRPPLDCVFMLKLELLARQFRLSDREVIAAVRFNIAYRLFLGISLKSPLPHHTLLTYFRQRLGPDRLQQVFDNLVGQARRLGLVKDRLRLKDATHIIANIAVPSTIRLVAEIREQLLAALEPFAATRVAEEQTRAEAIRLATEDVKDEECLLQRVTHLRSILAWADDVPAAANVAAGNVAAGNVAPTAAAERLRSALALAHKILADREAPEAGDKVISVHDPDARCGKHGDFYDGYLLDVAMDANSEIITAINVLPANGNEGADAIQLLRQEEQAHGNHVETLSIDGAGYRGDLLRELTDPQGLNVEVIVPPTERLPLTVFGPEQFTFSDDRRTLTCPAGQTTTQHERNTNDTGEKFRFSKKQCGGCALREQCLSNPRTKSRTVIKNDYEAEYRAAQAKAQTPAYAATRKEHPAIERKLSELVNRHDARHARYRGRPGVRWQMLLTGLVVNLKRIVRLLSAGITAARGGPASVGTVRAELVGAN